MKTKTSVLWAYLEKENLDAFAREVHRGMETASLSLAEVGDLILELHERYFDPEYEEISYDRYLGCLAFIYCAGYFVFAELARHKNNGTITLSGSELIRNDQRLDICKLREQLRKKAEEMGEPCDFEPWIQNLMDGETLGNRLQMALLDNFNEQHAALIMVMAEYLHGKSLEDLAAEERFCVSEHTREDMKAQYNRIISVGYGHDFYDLCSFEELQGLGKAQKDLKAADTAKEFVLAAADMEIWCGWWFRKRVTFPYHAYLLLTDDQYPVRFLDETNGDV